MDEHSGWLAALQAACAHEACSVRCECTEENMVSYGVHILYDHSMWNVEVVSFKLMLTAWGLGPWYIYDHLCLCMIMHECSFPVWKGTGNSQLPAVLTLFCRSEEFAPHWLRKPRRLHGGPWPLQLEVGVNGAGLAGVYCLLVALLEGL